MTLLNNFIAAVSLTRKPLLTRQHGRHLAQQSKLQRILTPPFYCQLTGGALIRTIERQFLRKDRTMKEDKSD